MPINFKEENYAKQDKAASSLKDSLPRGDGQRFPLKGRINLLADLVDKRRPKIATPLAIVVAHPDDEIIGIGAQLQRLQDVTLIHVTEGSPRKLDDANWAGFSTVRDYANARRQELRAALGLAGIPLSRTIELHICDQEASLQLSEMIQKIQEIVDRLKPKALFTHPYEGGHPDHDATAFAVHAACTRLPCPPQIIEMTSYHGSNGQIITGEFLPTPSRKIWSADLTQEEAQIKQRMLGCFATQARVLQAFQVRSERFRLAPRYDFTSAPHPGPLYYERADFGMTGQRFCSLTRTALSVEKIQGRI